MFTWTIADKTYFNKIALDTINYKTWAFHNPYQAVLMPGAINLQQKGTSGKKQI